MQHSTSEIIATKRRVLSEANEYKEEEDSRESAPKIKDKKNVIRANLNLGKYLDKKTQTVMVAVRGR